MPTEPRAYVFEAQLADYPGVSRTIAVAGHQTLEALHAQLRVAFGWDDDHLYAFWLDGEFWGKREYTAPFEPEEGTKTADAPLESIGLETGQHIAYVFDFGDEWRVTIRVADIRPAGGELLPQILESHGEAPPQYPDHDEEDE